MLKTKYAYLWFLVGLEPTSIESQSTTLPLSYKNHIKN